MEDFDFLDSENFSKICKSLRDAANILQLHSPEQKNRALLCVQKSLENFRSKIFLANEKDIQIAKKNGMSNALVERLALDEKKFRLILDGVEIVRAQNDPIGQTIAGWQTETGLFIRQVRFPLGVVAIIFESRPNVCVDAFCLAYKSGNAILLRGSSSAKFSNYALFNAIRAGLVDAGADGLPNAISLSQSKSGNKSDVDLILNAKGKIDCVLPRGGKNLIQNVTENSKIPVIETGAGVCHLFVDESADLKKAATISENAKIQRPGACNAIECILVHEKIAQKFIPIVLQKFSGRVEVRCCEKSFEIAQKNPQKNKIVKATEEDFGFEFLDLVCSLKIVSSLEDAISFINSHNSKHSDAIVTENLFSAKKFQSEVDAACVYVNASTRFTDGARFGFGAELGISTQKLHARGPMGLLALTTTKFLIDGNGQIAK